MVQIGDRGLELDQVESTDQGYNLIFIEVHSVSLISPWASLSHILVELGGDLADQTE